MRQNKHYVCEKWIHVKCFLSRRHQIIMESPQVCLNPLLFTGAVLTVLGDSGDAWRPARGDGRQVTSFLRKEGFLWNKRGPLNIEVVIQNVSLIIWVLKSKCMKKCLIYKIYITDCSISCTNFVYTLWGCKLSCWIFLSSSKLLRDSLFFSVSIVER